MSKSERDAGVGEALRRMMDATSQRSAHEKMRGSLPELRKTATMKERLMLLEGIGSRNGVSAAREGVRRLHIAQVRAKMPFVHRHWTGGPR